MSDNTITIPETEYNRLKAAEVFARQYELVLTNLVNKTGIINRDTIAGELIPRGLLLGLSMIRVIANNRHNVLKTLCR